MIPPISQQHQVRQPAAVGYRGRVPTLESCRQPWFRAAWRAGCCIALFPEQSDTPVARDWFSGLGPCLTGTMHTCVAVRTCRFASLVCRSHISLLLWSECKMPTPRRVLSKPLPSGRGFGSPSSSFRLDASLISFVWVLNCGHTSNLGPLVAHPQHEDSTRPFLPLQQVYLPTVDPEPYPLARVQGTVIA